MKNLSCGSLKVEDDQLYILDQQALPGKEIWVHAKTPYEMIDIIKALKIRGAPAIGVSAALSLASYALSGVSSDEVLKAAKDLKAARPTAINLMAAIDRMIPDMSADPLSPEQLASIAVELFDEDVKLCEQMAQNGLPLIDKGDNILTHCNTGVLATVGIGTALGVIHKAHQEGLNIHVYVDETRPLLQGARLSTWELKKWGVPYTLICDNAAASLMQAGKIQKVFLGSDRIAANGDFANKVGTYSVAVNAKHHGIPFYVVAPYTTLDKNCPTGKDIPIEERAMEEIRGAKGSFGAVEWAPTDCQAANPAFDVTPVELIDGIVMDKAYFPREEIQKSSLKEIV